MHHIQGRMDAYWSNSGSVLDLFDILDLHEAPETFFILGSSIIYVILEKSQA